MRVEDIYHAIHSLTFNTSAPTKTIRQREILVRYRRTHPIRDPIYGPRPNDVPVASVVCLEVGRRVERLNLLLEKFFKPLGF